MWWYNILLLIITNINCEESSTYLQHAVRDLRKMNWVQTLKRADTAIASQTVIPKAEIALHPTLTRRIHHEAEVPPLSLTRGELASLYKSAVAKGETIKLDSGDDDYIHTAVHELDNPDVHDPSYDNTHPYSDESDHDHSSGYYYYYYPIKSFMDEFSSEPTSNFADYTHKPTKHRIFTTERSPYQFHSHHHQHNITINKAMDGPKKNSLEPLFMAISGFIGMAVMFVLSVLVLPKFGSKKTNGNKNKLWISKRDDDIEEFARLALTAIENKQCAERFACELSKTARTFNLQDNRFLRLLKRMAPGTFGRHFDQVEKYRNKQIKCTAIPCKKNNNVPPRKKHPAQKKH